MDRDALGKILAAEQATGVEQQSSVSAPTVPSERMVAAQESDWTGQILPNQVVADTYRIESELGRGGMGVVTRAVDFHLERPVAIKFIRPDLVAHAELRTFFANEARAMARVSHPNVVTIHTFGQHGSTSYFIMEFVDGITVEAWLATHLSSGALPPIADALDILDQACAGTHAIHQAGTAHRDLKPSNLLLSHSKRVFVSDLGVAHMAGGREVDITVMVGSAGYMAPEAALGTEVEPALVARRDVYALGCIAFELLTGRPVFEKADPQSLLRRHIVAEPDRPSAVRPTLGTAFDSIVLRALAKAPEQRWESAELLRSALAAARLGTPTRLLIVDDDPDWQALLSTQILQEFPHAIIDAVGDGPSALTAAAAQEYAAVLVDLDMPGMHGSAVVAALRSDPTMNRLPIIVLTASGGSSEWRALSELGADGFLLKPVHAEDLCAVLQKVIRRRGQSQAP